LRAGQLALYRFAPPLYCSVADYELLDESKGAGTNQGLAIIDLDHILPTTGSACCRKDRR